MTTDKIETTEEAAASIKNAFTKLGLNEDGTVKEEKKEETKFVDNFKDAAKEVESEWKEGKEEAAVEQEEIDQADDNKELIKAKAELQARDEAIAKMQQMINDLSEKASKQQKAEQDRMLNDIEKQRRQAVANGDYDAVVSLDRQKEQVLGIAPALDPVYADFLKRNPWWSGTSALEIKMRAAANQYDNVISNQKLTPAQGTALLEECIRNDFPEYFNKTDRKETKVAAVEGNVNAGIVKNSKKRYTLDNLDKEAKHIAKEFERLGKVKPDDYVQELVKAGLIK